MPYEIRLLRVHVEKGPAGQPMGPARNRIFFVLEGGLRVGDEELAVDGACHSAASPSIQAIEPSSFLCWELARAGAPPGPVSSTGVGGETLLTEPVTGLDPGDGKQWLMRCDSVSFPPGGCAFTHVHRGPGIRYLLEGSIEIDTGGSKTPHGQGEAWFESGPEPVFAQADGDIPTRFIRAMILPLSLLGRSSISYVNEEDKDKPKSQSYRGYIDQPIEL